MCLCGLAMRLRGPSRLMRAILVAEMLACATLVHASCGVPPNPSNLRAVVQLPFRRIAVQLLLPSCYLEFMEGTQLALNQSRRMHSTCERALRFRDPASRSCPHAANVIWPLALALMPHRHASGSGKGMCTAPDKQQTVAFRNTKLNKSESFCSKRQRTRQIRSKYLRCPCVCC